MITKVPDGTGQVIKVLQDSTLYTLDEIHEKTDLELGTIRYAIRRLLEVGIIKSFPELTDMRTVKYRVASEGELNNAFAELPPDVVSILRGYFRVE